MEGRHAPWNRFFIDQKSSATQVHVYEPPRCLPEELAEIRSIWQEAFGSNVEVV